MLRLAVVCLFTLPLLALSDEPNPANPHDPDELPFFGVGVRFGYERVSLNASNVPYVESQLQGWVNDYNRNVTAYNTYAHPNPPVPLSTVQSLSLSTQLFTITPTFHFGGDGYFFKLDVPIGLSSDFDAFGVGLYPLNYGHYIPSLRLFPYGSIGIVAGATIAGSYHAPIGPTVTMNALGAKVEVGRFALGAKLRLVGGINVGAEVGYAPFSVAAFLDTAHLSQVQKNANSATPPQPPPLEAIGRGGYGAIWDGSLLVEWM
jgi:hypothetical protein